jgi:hypothetical protein
MKTERGLIIGLAGKAGHGKNYVANVLCDYYPGMRFRKVAFADRVKQVYSIISGETVEDSLEWKNGMSDFGMTRREAFQKIGTDLFRKHFHEDIWIYALFSGLDPTQNYIITDVRFLNEVNAIHNAGGVVFRVSRPNYESGTPAHESEEAIDLLNLITIINPGNGDMAIKAQMYALEEMGKILY